MSILEPGKMYDLASGTRTVSMPCKCGNVSRFLGWKLESPEVVRLSTEKVGTSQIGRTVRVVEAAFHLRLGEADARKHVPAVLVPG